MPDRALNLWNLMPSVLLGFGCHQQVLAVDDPPSRPIDELVSIHCGSCHRDGGSGPFVLQEGQDLLRRKQFIATVLETGLMPPWPLSGGLPVHGDRRLSDAEKSALLQWLSSGVLPEGPDQTSRATAKDMVPQSVDFAGLSLGMRRPWTVPAEGGRRWFKAERDKRTFLMPLANDEDLRVNQISYHTTAPLALAAVALSSDDSGQARRYIDWDTDSGTYMAGDVGFTAAGSLAVIGPAGGTLALPSGYHLPIPKNSDIVSEVHFRPQGRPWNLDDSVRLSLVPEGVASKPLVPVNLMLRNVSLASGQSLDETRSLTFEQDVTLVAITPRAGRRCTALSLLIESPDGSTRTAILESEDWNPHYRATVVLKEPVFVPSGSRAIGHWHYDNSDSNPRNPVIPPEEVSLGARCGIANFLLLCATNSKAAETELRNFSRKHVIKSQR